MVNLDRWEHPDAWGRLIRDYEAGLLREAALLLAKAELAEDRAAYEAALADAKARAAEAEKGLPELRAKLDALKAEAARVGMRYDQAQEEARIAGKRLESDSPAALAWAEIAAPLRKANARYTAAAAALAIAKQDLNRLLELGAQLPHPTPTPTPRLEALAAALGLGELQTDRRRAGQA